MNGKLFGLGLLQRYAARLRYPYLFALVAAVFFVDLVVPDVIPFADEIVLGLLTVLLGRLRRKESEPEGERPATKNVTPPRPGR